MKYLFAILIWTVTLSGHGQVLVYKGTQASTFIGGNRSQIVPIGGNFLYDVSSGRCVVIGAYVEGGVKKYRVNEKTNFTVGVVSGSLGLKYTVLEELYEGVGGSRGSVYLKGLNALLTVATRQTFTAPRTFSGHVRELYHHNGALTAHEGSATAAYDQAATVKANNGNATIDDLVSSISAGLRDKGYVSADTIGHNGNSLPGSQFGLAGQTGESGDSGNAPPPP